jgi:hypothetical protein
MGTLWNSSRSRDLEGVLSDPQLPLSELRDILFATRWLVNPSIHVVAGVRTVTTQIRRDSPKTVAPFRFLLKSLSMLARARGNVKWTHTIEALREFLKNVLTVSLVYFIQDSSRVDS